MNVLVVDREENGAAGLVALLAEGGHAVRVATPKHALEDALASSVDLVIVTRTLEPEVSLAFVRAVRGRNAAIPLMVLTAEGLVEERVRALEAGADDALAVPFAHSQMAARTSALGRRARLVPKAPEVLEVDGCYFDLDRGSASRDGKTIALANREVEILRWLHRNRARAVSRKELLANVFGVSPDVETRSVDMAIAVLRKKIERDPREPRIVLSRVGVGYAWGG